MHKENRKMIGAPGAIRTPDPQIRSLMLYPAELRVRYDRHLAGSAGQRKSIGEVFSIGQGVGRVRQ